jgi:hypothetical protein
VISVLVLDWTIWYIWPIGSVAIVIGIAVFLGLELLAHWMRPQEKNEENPEGWHDAFSKHSTYSLTALVLLFVLMCVVIGVAVLLK